MTEAMGNLLFGVCLFLFVFIIMIGILRWSFRINDIVKRLDDIKPLVEAMGYIVERLNTIIRLLEGKKEEE